MKRIQLDFCCFDPNFFGQAKAQYPEPFRNCNTLREIALFIRDELKLNKCTRVHDSLIFTEK